MTAHGKKLFISFDRGASPELKSLVGPESGGFRADPPDLQENDFIFALKIPSDASTQYEFDKDALEQLGATMEEPSEDVSGDSDIPAGYTYFGQFVDHDITHDVKTKYNPLGNPPVCDHIYTGTPMLDLNSLYGTDGTQLHKGKFELQEMAGDSTARPFDLPRLPANLWTLEGKKIKRGTAAIPDMRNEDNLIVFSMHLLFTVFHNALMEYLDKRDDKKGGEEVRDLVILHYQWLVLNDFLRRICDPGIFRDVMALGPTKFYTMDDHRLPYMPLEFSGAAFRYGHSQVRKSYFWRRQMQTVFTADLMTGTGLHNLSGTSGPSALQKIWQIDWDRFLDFPGAPLRSEGFNYARKIDTWISPALSQLPGENPDDPAAVLAKRTLVRGLTAYKLPSAQAFAEHIKEPVLGPDIIYETALAGAGENRAKLFDEYEFHKRTPLWFYCLVEAQQGGGNKLGPIASRVVAEVLYAMAARTKPSIINEDGSIKSKLPDSPFGELVPGEFCLKHIVEFVSKMFEGRI